MTIDITTLQDRDLEDYRRAAFCDLHFCIIGIREGFEETCGERLVVRALRNTATIRQVDRELFKRKGVQL